MKIEYTGRQTEVPPELRRLAERKLRKLAQVLPGITRAHVILTADKHRQIAEVTVRSPRLDLDRQEASSDLGVSLATVMDKLTRQAQRHLGKLRERKREAPRPGAASPRQARQRRARRDGRPTVIRSRRLPCKPMTLEEAALEVGSREDGVVVFRDAATER